MRVTLWNAQQGHQVLSQAWTHAKNLLMAGHRLTLELKPESKNREQEKRYHAMIGDIAKQYTHAGRMWDAEDMKRLLVDAFKAETKNDPEFRDLWVQMGDLRLVPAIGRDGYVALGDQTRKFPKKLATAFIAWLFAFGAEASVVWSDPSQEGM